MAGVIKKLIFDRMNKDFDIKYVKIFNEKFHCLYLDILSGDQWACKAAAAFEGMIGEDLR